jgi:hypothetical protein
LVHADKTTYSVVVVVTGYGTYDKAVETGAWLSGLVSPVAILVETGPDWILPSVLVETGPEMILVGTREMGAVSPVFVFVVVGGWDVGSSPIEMGAVTVEPVFVDTGLLGFCSPRSVTHCPF